MKTPTHCPCCKKPLLNESMPTIGKAFWRKSCTKTLTHSVVFTTQPGNDDEVYKLTIRIKDGLLMTWVLDSKFCWLSKTADLEWSQGMPFWEPDLSDYQKLINKVKIYILFS